MVERRDFSKRTTGSPLAALIKREINGEEYVAWMNAKRAHNGLSPLVPIVSETPKK